MRERHIQRAALWVPMKHAMQSGPRTIYLSNTMRLMRNYRPLESARKLRTVRLDRVAAGHQNILSYTLP